MMNKLEVQSEFVELFPHENEKYFANQQQKQSMIVRKSDIKSIWIEDCVFHHYDCDDDYGFNDTNYWFTMDYDDCDDYWCTCCFSVVVEMINGVMHTEEYAPLPDDVPEHKFNYMSKDPYKMKKIRDLRYEKLKCEMGL
jgi:hypothetical protein